MRGTITSMAFNGSCFSIICPENKGEMVFVNPEDIHWGVTTDASGKYCKRKQFKIGTLIEFDPPKTEFSRFIKNVHILQKCTENGELVNAE